MKPRIWIHGDGQCHNTDVAMRRRPRLCGPLRCRSLGPSGTMPVGLTSRTAIIKRGLLRAPAPCAPQVAPVCGAYLAARGTSRLPGLQALEHTEPLCQQLKRDERLGEGRAGRFIDQFRLIIELVASPTAGPGITQMGPAGTVACHYSASQIRRMGRPDTLYC